MKVWQRIIIKFIIFLLVVTAAGGGVAGWRAYQQSTPEYAVRRYLTLLTENDSEKAYSLLDQSEEKELSREEYASVLEAKQYGLYASFKVEELEQRLGNDGTEYMDFHVEFMDAADETQAQEDFTVKKQEEAVFGVFDKWKILSGHCMVRNFLLTVPAGSEVYIEGEAADAAWIVRDNVSLSRDCYQIPSILPGKCSLVVRHPALEAVNTTLDTADGSADFSGKMPLKESAQNECLELGIKALQQLYAAAVTEKTNKLDEVMADCQSETGAFIKEQGAEFNKEDSIFRNAAVSGFSAQFGELEFTEGESGAITTEMSLSYHYVVQEDVMADTGEYQEDGTPVQETNTDSHSGDNTARFTMSFYDGAWHITDIDVPTI